MINRSDFPATVISDLVVQLAAPAALPHRRSRAGFLFLSFFFFNHILIQNFFSNRRRSPRLSATKNVQVVLGTTTSQSSQQLKLTEMTDQTMQQVYDIYLWVRNAIVSVSRGRYRGWFTRENPTAPVPPSAPEYADTAAPKLAPGPARFAALVPFVINWTICKS